MTTYLTMFKDELSDYLSSLIPSVGPQKRLFEAMNYSLLGEGKRLRPALCMAVAETFGIPRRHVWPAAAALEMIHAYSLIHDDLPCMDDDDLRRGRPTNHVVYGEAMALLAGDGLLTQAFVELSKPLVDVPPVRQIRMLHILSSRAGAEGMVGGQAVDIELTGEDGEMSQVQFIHLHKTARLIQASIEIGALFPDLSDASYSALSVYGEALGLAFQMIDDVLDIVGSKEELGKTPGKDEEEGKLTYPRLIGVEATRRLAKETIARGEAALREAGIVSAQLSELQSMVLDRVH